MQKKEVVFSYYLKEESDDKFLQCYFHPQKIIAGQCLLQISDPE